MIWSGLKIYFAIGGCTFLIFLIEDGKSLLEMSRTIEGAAGVPRWIMIPIYLLLLLAIGIGWPFVLWEYAKGLIAGARAEWKKWRGK